MKYANTGGTNPTTRPQEGESTGSMQQHSLHSQTTIQKVARKPGYTASAQNKSFSNAQLKIKQPLNKAWPLMSDRTITIWNPTERELRTSNGHWPYVPLRRGTSQSTIGHPPPPLEGLVCRAENGETATLGWGPAFDDRGRHHRDELEVWRGGRHGAKNSSVRNRLLFNVLV